MALSAGEITAVLKLRDELTGAIGRAMTGGVSGFGAMTKAADLFDTRTLSIVDSLKSVTGFSQVGQILAGGMQSFQNATFGVNAQLETTELQFATLMGSAERAKGHVKDLFEIAKKTPFETTQIITASRHLQTFGGDALNTKANIMLMGDAAAATNAPIEQLGFWVGRAYSSIKNGQPFGEASMRLQEMAVLSGETRLKMEALQKSGASTTEVWGAFTEALGKHKGAMERMAGTWQGVTSTFTDTINIVTAMAFKPFFEMIRDGFAMFNEIAGGDELGAWAAKTADTIKGGINVAMKYLFDLFEQYGPVVATLAGKLSALLGPAINFVVAYSKALIEEWKFLAPIVLALVDDFMSLAPAVGVVIDVLAFLISKVGDLFAYLNNSPIGEYVQDFIVLAVEIGGSVWAFNAIVAAVGLAAAAFAEWAVATAVNTVMIIANFIATSVAAGTMWAAILGPVGLVIAGLALVGAAAYATGKYFGLWGNELPKVNRGQLDVVIAADKAGGALNKEAMSAEDASLAMANMDAEANKNAATNDVLSKAATKAAEEYKKFLDTIKGVEVFKDADNWIRSLGETQKGLGGIATMTAKQQESYRGALEAAADKATALQGPLSALAVKYNTQIAILDTVKESQIAAGVAQLNSNGVTLRSIEILKNEGKSTEDIARLNGVRVESIDKLIKAQQLQKSAAEGLASFERATAQQSRDEEARTKTARASALKTLTDLEKQYALLSREMTSTTYDAAVAAVEDWALASIQSTSLVGQEFADYVDRVMKLSEIKKAKLLRDNKELQFAMMQSPGLPEDAFGTGGMDSAGTVSKVKANFEDYRVAIGGLSQAFSQLSQIAGGSMNDTVRWLGSVIGSMNAATEAGAQMKAGFDKGGVAGFTQMGVAAIGAAGAIMQATSTASKAQNVMGGVMTGASAGAAFGTVGAVVGATIGLVTGLFRKTTDEAKKSREALLEQVGGIEKLSEMAKEAGVSIDKMMSTKSIKEFEAEQKKLNAAVKAHAEMLDKVNAAAGAVASGLAAVLKESTSEWLNMGSAVEKATSKTKAAQDALKSALGTLDGSQKSIDELNKLQEAYKKALDEEKVLNGERGVMADGAKTKLADLGVQATAAFSAALLATGDYSNALAIVGPSLKTLSDSYKALGLDVEDVALKHLLIQATVAETNPNLMAAIGGLSGSMQGLAQLGLLNVDTFGAMQRTGTDMYAKLQGAVAAAGGTTRDALLPMQGYLQQAAAQAELLGLPLDANTLRLIDQSKELGLWKDKGKSANDLLIAGMTALVAKLDEMITRISGVTTGITNIPNVQRTVDIVTRYSYVDEGDPRGDGGGDAPPFASGTLGRTGSFFHDFGKSTAAYLHGDEAVVRRDQIAQFVAQYGGSAGGGSAAPAQGSVEVDNSDILVALQQQTRALKMAFKEAMVMK